VHLRRLDWLLAFVVEVEEIGNLVFEQLEGDQLTHVEDTSGQVDKSIATNAETFKVFEKINLLGNVHQSRVLTQIQGSQLSVVPQFRRDVRNLSASQVKVTSLDEFPQQGVPMVGACVGPRDLVSHVNFVLFLHDFLLAESVFEVLLQLDCACRSHGRLDGAQGIAFDVDSNQLGQE